MSNKEIRDDLPKGIIGFDSADTVHKIPVNKIIPNSFEPQERRRKSFFTEKGREAIDKFGDEILSDGGLIHPILLRPHPQRKGFYEIACGERRWLAHKAKKIKRIQSFVQDLTDAQVIERNYKENHNRQEPDVLNDAFTFKYLIDNEDYTEVKLADHFATTVENVCQKLRLNDLVPEVADELQSGGLPLKHAYYIARFPADTQREIQRLQLAYKYYDSKEKAVAFTEFKEEVETQIIRRLSDAPFPVDDARLHIKKLLCNDCPDNSARQTHLFPKLAREASCLNKSCFELKTNVFMRLRREEIAAKNAGAGDVPIEELEKSVPLVTDRSWIEPTMPFKEKVLTGQKLLDEPECAFSEVSLAVGGTRKCKDVYICRNPDCETHGGEPWDTDKFERDVCLLTREKVLTEAIKAFDDYNPIWMFDDLIQKLILELWLVARDALALKPILRIIKNWKNLPKNAADREQVEKFIASCDRGKQSRLIFLMIFATSSQDEIIKICASYARRNYQLLEAEARVELSPENEKELAADALTLTRAGLTELSKPNIDLSDRVH